MQIPPAGRTSYEWAARIANWNQVVAGVLAFASVGALQGAILAPLINSLFTAINDGVGDWWKSGFWAITFALPTAATASCIACDVVSTCKLLEANRFADARRFCRRQASVLVSLHGIPLGLAGLWRLEFIPYLTVLDLGFQISLLLFLWSQWLPRNEMERYSNEKSGE